LRITLRNKAAQRKTGSAANGQKGFKILKSPRTTTLEGALAMCRDHLATELSNDILQHEPSQGRMQWFIFCLLFCTQGLCHNALSAWEPRARREKGRCCCQGNSNLGHWRFKYGATKAPKGTRVCLFFEKS